MPKNRSGRMKIWPQDASEIEIEAVFIHPAYELHAEESAKATPTNLLRLFSIVPNRASDPSFFGRHDAKDGMNPQVGSSAIDIDVVGLKSGEEADFIAGKRGYSGHHSAKLPDGTHRISIRTPELGQIFEGVLSMNASVRGELMDICDLDIKDSVRIFVEETGEVLYSASEIPTDRAK
jgi:hypothetical protein